MPRPYNKPAITYDEQVEKLRARGMVIADADSAKAHLQHINYYRFSAYRLPFETNHATHQLKAGTTFEDVLRLYNFDRQLRLLVLDAVEKIEVSVRGQWAYQLGHTHGSHSHLDATIAKKAVKFSENLISLKEEVDRSDEVFIHHLVNEYEEELPAVWAVCEVMSIGLLSRWYANLKPAATRQQISKVYDLDQKLLVSWLHHLTVVRNICAHHSRLWDREFMIAPMTPKSTRSDLQNQFNVTKKVYNTLVILLYMLDKIPPRNYWRAPLKALLTGHREWLDSMGFPTDWETRTIWQDTP